MLRFDDWLRTRPWPLKLAMAFVPVILALVILWLGVIEWVAPLWIAWALGSALCVRRKRRN